MTATVLRQRNQSHPASSPFSVPRSQNTAPVLEFRCLWTTDLRRKAKRWQDGYLRWHTFNNRIMVYDDQRNYIGDTHRSEAAREVEDGEEFTLERSGKMVQCGERLGLTQTDLSELLAKRVAKPIEQEPAARSVQAVRHPTAPRTAMPIPNMPVKWQGRAVVPQQSPYEIRQAQDATSREPPNKRQRRDDEHIPLCELIKTAMNRPNKLVLNNFVSHQPLRLPNAPKAVVPARRWVANEDNNDRQSPLSDKQVVDLTLSSSADLPTRAAPRTVVPATGASHHARFETSGRSPRSRKSPLRKEYPGAAAASSEPETSTLPARVTEDHGTQIRSQSMTDAAVVSRNTSQRRSESLNVEPKAHINPVERATMLPRIPSNPLTKVRKRLRPKPKTQHLPPDVTVPSSPPVSTTNHLPPQEVVESPSSENDCNTAPSGSKQQTTPRRKTQELRITARGAKKTLLCQSLAQTRPIPPLDQPATGICSDQTPRNVLLVDKVESPKTATERRMPSNTSSTTPSRDEQAVMRTVVDVAEADLETGADQGTHDARKIVATPDRGGGKDISNVQSDAEVDIAAEPVTTIAEVEECEPHKEQPITPSRQSPCPDQSAREQITAPPPAIRAAMPLPKPGPLAPQTPGTTTITTVRRPFQPLHINPIAPPISKAKKDRPSHQPPSSRPNPGAPANAAVLVTSCRRRRRCRWCATRVVICRPCRCGKTRMRAPGVARRGTSSAGRHRDVR